MTSQEEILVVGRGVYALPLLRILGTPSRQNKNDKIIFATSVGWKDLGAVSRCVDEVVHVPRADKDLEGFTTALCDLVKRKRHLTTIIPVVEETLFLTLPKVVNRIQQAAAHHETTPRILTSSYQTLMKLNDKFQFQKALAEIMPQGQIPKTNLVKNPKQLLQAIQDCVEANKAASSVMVKPACGRGSLGAHKIGRADWESLSSQELLQRYPLPVDANQALTTPYVVQEFVEGHEYSTFSLCLDGIVVAHVCYRPQQVATHGFSPIRDLAPPEVYLKSLDYIQTLASSLSLTGHFGLDVMQRFNGDLVALECNPRVTNGLAFLAPRCTTEMALRMQRAYLGRWTKSEWKNAPVISPANNSPQHIMTLLPTLSCVAKARNSSERMQLLEVAMKSKDDIWQSTDPLPFLMMVCRFACALLMAMVLQLVNPVVDEHGNRLKASELLKRQVQDEIVQFEESSTGTSSNATEMETVGGLTMGTINDHNTQQGLRVLVTGATGFLGGRVVRALHQGWDDKSIPLPNGVQLVTAVTATGRNQQKGDELMQSLDQSKGKTQFQAADLSNAEETYQLVRGHDVVIHCAALCALWTRWEDYIAANVTATENIAHACHLNGVRLLVHISSPSLCTPVDTDDRFNIQETEALPDDDKQANRYSATKKQAEVIVSDVSKRYNLPTIVLRPRAIFGPGDTTLFPLLLERLQAGKLAIVGKGRECFGDYTYVENVVAACLCCLDKAPTTNSPKIYAITNDDSRRLWDIIDTICERMQLNKPWKRIPRPVAYNIAYVLEGISALLLLFGYQKIPLFTRYTVNVVSRSTTFDISAAKRELGYKPVVSFDDGCERFLRSVDTKQAL